MKELEEIDKRQKIIEAEIKQLEKIIKEFMDERKIGNFGGVEVDELQNKVKMHLQINIKSVQNI